MAQTTPTFYTHTNEQLAMSQEQASMEPATPAMPERAVRRSEDVGRPLASSESKRYWRSSEQPAGLRPRAPSGAGLSRPSDDGPPHQGPTNQLAHWQPPHDEYAGYEDHEPSPPRDYYLVPRGVNPAAPSPSPYPSSEQPLYRRNVRSSNETHRPLVHQQTTPRRRPSVRPHRDDDYYDEAPSRPPVRRTPQKSRTGIYVVREGGGDGGDGSEPGEMMRLPFSSWMHGSLKARKISD